MGKVTFENRDETRILEVVRWLEEKGQQGDFRLGTGGGCALNKRLTPLDDSVGIFSKDYYVVSNREKTRREFIGGLYLSNRGATPRMWKFFMNGEKNISFVQKLMEELTDRFNVEIFIVIANRDLKYEKKALDYSSSAGE